MKEVKFYRCPRCGNVIELIDGDSKRITCCGKNMELLVANTVDASVEKHVPIYEVNGNEIVVKVGDVIHPMEEKHYIMWIALVSDNKVTRVDLLPNEAPEAVFDYVEKAEVYAYCNLHGLWKTTIE